MKKLFVLLFVLAFSPSIYAQDTYTVNNETLELNMEVDGTLDLLWNTFDNQYRYFVRSSDGTIVELKNTKGSSNSFQEEYKATLELLTKEDPSEVKLTTYSLKSFIQAYNISADPNASYEDNKSQLKLRLGLFGGLTNNPFVDNPGNENTLSFGAELEVLSDESLPNQAGFVSLRHSPEADNFKYSSTQLALGYRFRFINLEGFNVYAQTKFVTLTASKSTVSFVNGASELIVEERSETAFDAPLIFGIGADIKLGSGYITMTYDSLFAVLVDNQGNFPVDFALGYKFNL